MEEFVMGEDNYNVWDQGFSSIIKKKVKKYEKFFQPKVRSITKT